MKPRPAPAELRAMIDAGIPVGQIADKIGVTYNTAWKWLNDAGLRSTAIPYKADPARIATRQQIVALHSQGLSVNAIVQRLKCGTSTVHRALGFKPEPQRQAVVRSAPSAEALRQSSIFRAAV